MPAFMSAALTVPASYSAAPDVALQFLPDELIIRAVSGNFFYSFDGVNDHGMLNSTDAPQLLFTKRTKIWFKQNGGAATARLSALTIA